MAGDDHGFINEEMDVDESEDDQSYSDDDDLGVVLHEPDDVESAEVDDFTFTVLTPDEIVQHMCDIIRDVNQVMQLHATTTRMLLNHMKWDKGKLMETYYSNPEDLFKKAHIVSPFHRSTSNSSSQGGGSSGSGPMTRSNSNKPIIHNYTQEVTCDICLLEYPGYSLSGLECGHRFCKNCWAEYLTTKIMQEGMGQTIACAAHKCDILVDDATVMTLVSDKKVKLRYQQLITNSFVECNRLLRWCPWPDCPNAIQVTHNECKPVTCTCGMVFCFTCSHEWHEPISCRLLRRWLKKCSDDSETSNWISANTKECPKCHVTIEKNGGCNHMICKNVACREEFCWICLGPWQPHGSSWFNCNRFDDAAAKTARDAQARSRAALDRYLFYYNRYANHHQSMKLENKLYSSIKSKMEEIQADHMSWIDVQFLKMAVDVLCQCRRTLMYTYAFSYYLVSSNEVHIFEDNQKDLEHSTELLSEYLERDINKDNMAEIKPRVQDKYRYCESRRKILLDHCKEGNEKEVWEYME